MDRRQALAIGSDLPDRAVGTALFADVSGFTPLTDALTRSLGPKRGAEELTKQLNAVYDALIGQVDRWHGSVIGFSGDAITCWFDDADQPGLGARRATACAIAMQAAMQQFAEVSIPDGTTVALAVKTSCASGQVRRFVVGDPQVHLLDAIAGETLQRMSHGEHAANKGDNLIDDATAALLGENAILGEQRESDGDHFFVLQGVQTPFPPDPWAEHPPLPEAVLKQWVIPEVYARLESGLGDFLTELRPCVAVFLRFSGIDYDHDEDAPRKLQDYCLWVQSILSAYDGLFVDITIGDKGSYIYCSFGAPLAHEDDAWRAISTALELTRPPFDYIEPVQVGVSMGTMRTGACGSETRRTYAVLGNEVNLAARLMANCQPGTVLCSRRAQVSAGNRFEWEELIPIRVKGKSQPVQIARPVRPLSGGTRFEEYKGQMLGREQELYSLKNLFAPIFEEGQRAQLVYLHGEAGMGKSRLIYEFHKTLAEKPHRWFTFPAAGALNQSLYAFVAFLRDYFGVEPGQDEANKERLNNRIDLLREALRESPHPQAAELSDELDKRRVFLGGLIDLHWEGSPYERLDPKLRHEVALRALIHLIQAEAATTPTILHFEDAHLLDAESQGVLITLVRESEAFPLGFIAACRYDDEGKPFKLPTLTAEETEPIDLNALTGDGIRGMGLQVLGGNLSDDFVYFLRQKTQGNPFYIEQMLLDLYERGLILDHEGELSVQLDSLPDLPGEINALLVARLDRLEAHIKAVVQIASVIGNEFEMQVLTHMLVEDGRLLDKVRQAEAEAIWNARSEVEYLFRHALMSDAAYNIQLYEQLKHWHAQAAKAIEAIYADSLPTQAATLTKHAHRAEDRDRELTYSRMAGERAVTNFASEEAIYYLSRALELTAESDYQTRYDLLRLREKIYDLMGNRKAQADDLTQINQLARALNDPRKQADGTLGCAQYYEVTGKYADSATMAERVIALAKEHGLTREAAYGHYYLGRARWRQGQLAEATHEIEESIRLARLAGAGDIEGKSITMQGLLAVVQSRYDEAKQHFEAALTLRRGLGDLQGEGIVLGNLAATYQYMNKLPDALRTYEDGLRLSREIGDRRSEGITLGNLGSVSQALGRFADAMQYYERALKINLATGNKRSEMLNYIYIARCAMYLGDNALAEQRLHAALDLSRELQDALNECIVRGVYAALLERLNQPEAAYQEALAAAHMAHTAGYKPQEYGAEMVLGDASQALGKPEEALLHYQHALSIQRETESLIYDAVAGIADALHTLGKIGEAVSALEEIIPALQGQVFDEMDEPARVFVAVVRVLRAAGDERASAILETGRGGLQRWIEALPDEAARAQFFAGGRWYQELLTMGDESGSESTK
jgi:predicted ATPase/class 3 adenylate cyclase